MTSQPGPVAFVLSSGANLGAVQVGMLRALIEHDIRPDLVVGCSIGAINGAGLAEDPTDTGVARLESLWQAMDGRDLMPRRWLPPPIVLAARRRDAVHTQDALAAVLRRTLAADRFEDLAVPFQCVATDIAAEREAWFSEGPLVEALLASAAIPAVYPLVEIDGRRYLDGGMISPIPVDEALAAGATHVLALQTRPYGIPRRSASRIGDRLIVRHLRGLNPALVNVYTDRIEKYERLVDDLGRRSRDPDAGPSHVLGLRPPVGSPCVGQLERRPEVLTRAADEAERLVEAALGRGLTLSGSSGSPPGPR